MSDMSLSVGTVILRNPNDTDLANRFTVTYPPSSLAYVQQINDAQSLVNSPSLSPSYAGLLYYPSNPRNCSDPTLVGNGIPEDGVTLDRLPLGFNLIALIPISACTSDYLLQAKRDQAEAAVLYNYSTMSTNPSTSLTDSFSVFNNPIYGITTQDTEALLPQVAAYSGNMSSVPFGSNLSQLYDPLDYVRLTLTINTGSGSSLPGLWLFLLVILAALGLIIASTSISMHVSQYRARRDLRRRIAAGEIDLESLGIKRLTVPKEMIDTMPIRIYGSSSITYSAPAIARQNEKPHRASIRRSSGDGDSRLSVSSNLPTSENAQKTGSTDDTPSTTGEIVSQTPPPPPAGFEQSSSCAICLDDYVVNTTPVRQLPCNHLFHPHCIDPYLSTRSSLCPLCKRSVLPKGFIPPSLQLTNATVARERRIRLMRERVSRRQTSSPDPEQLAGGVEMVNIGGGISGDNDMNAPTQEEEDEELRQRGWGRRVMETIFPRFTRPTGGSVRNPRRRSQYGSN